MRTRLRQESPTQPGPGHERGPPAAHVRRRALAARRRRAWPGALGLPPAGRLRNLRRRVPRGGPGWALPRTLRRLHRVRRSERLQPQRLDLHRARPPHPDRDGRRFAIGGPAGAIAGERQRGTLEVLLARPISRRRLYATVLATTLSFVVVALSANVAGVAAGAVASGVADELRMDHLALAWLNAILLFAALAALALAASASSDRLGPVLGLALGFTIVSYAVEFLAAIWPDIAGLRPWSLFAYFQPAEILAGEIEPGDLAVLAAVGVVAVAFGLWVFPRRDLAAPS
ncbi:MAG: ABC transporter permease subunit [Chloroflexota bacterium]